MSRVTIGSLQIPRNSARHTHINVNNKKQMELNGLLEELANGDNLVVKIDRKGSSYRMSFSDSQVLIKSRQEVVDAAVLSPGAVLSISRGTADL
jgi:predicted component of viral defense system (DUF524 family)